MHFQLPHPMPVFINLIAVSYILVSIYYEKEKREEIKMEQTRYWGVHEGVSWYNAFPTRLFNIGPDWSAYTAEGLGHDFWTGVLLEWL